MRQNSRPEKRELREIREYHTASCGYFFHVKKFLYQKVSPFQKIEIFENEAFGKILFLDGLLQTTEKDEFFYHEMLVHPALVTHLSPQRVLIIGGGDGGTLREVLRYKEVQEAVLVEIDADVIHACKKYFPWLPRALEDERSRLVVADGVKYIEETEKTYDVVIVDSSEPVGPSTLLHERGFYEKIADRLRPGGIVVAQSGSPFYHAESIGRMEGFLQGLFSIVRFYTGPVPAYPGGMWSYVFLSDRVIPIAVRRKPSPGLRYFHPGIHEAAFALPAFFKSPGLLRCGASEEP